MSTMYVPKNIPAFYVLLHSGAIAVSGSVFVRGMGSRSSVCFCPEKGVSECIFSGSENDVTRFHRTLLNEMSNLPNSYFPVIDMRGFRKEASEGDHHPTHAPVTEFERKILTLAAEICGLYSTDQGGQSCKDWEGAPHPFTEEESQSLSYNFQLENSGGEDYDEEELFMDDGMMLAAYIEAALLKILEGKAIAVPPNGRHKVSN